MLSAALLLLCNSLFLSLHLTGTAGSFPKPLSAARERECLERCAAGDLEARNTLVEHNLRPHHQEVLHTVCRPVGSDLHRDHRTHQGGQYLPPRQGDQAGHLCRPLYRKRDTHVLPGPEEIAG